MILIALRARHVNCEQYSSVKQKSSTPHDGFSVDAEQEKQQRPEIGAQRSVQLHGLQRNWPVETEAKERAGGKFQSETRLALQASS